MTSKMLARLVGALFAFALFLASSSSLHAQENRAALDAFMKQMREHDAVIEELVAKNRGTPGEGLVLIRTAAAGAQKITTAGLPDELQAAFRTYAERAQALADVFKDWPAKPEDVPEFINHKKAENPNFLTDGKKFRESAMTALAEAIANLSAVGKKFGLDGLSALLQ